MKDDKFNPEVFSYLFELFRNAGLRYPSNNFIAAVDSMACSGINFEILKSIPRLKGFFVAEPDSMDDFLGCYFGANFLEDTFPKHSINWRAAGWDGGDQVILVRDPNVPAWVYVHEFGHYIDDNYLRQISLLKEKYPWFEKRQFQLRWQAMQVEYTIARDLAYSTVPKAELSNPRWYEHAEFLKYFDKVPTPYALVTFAEWIAESFTGMCIPHRRMLLYGRCPDTVAFLQLALFNDGTKGKSLSIPDWKEQQVFTSEWEGRNIRLQGIVDASTKATKTR